MRQNNHLGQWSVSGNWDSDCVSAIDHAVWCLNDDGNVKLVDAYCTLKLVDKGAIVEMQRGTYHFAYACSNAIVAKCIEDVAKGAFQAYRAGRSSARKAVAVAIGITDTFGM
jgi:hypothetical protein